MTCLLHDAKVGAAEGVVAAQGGSYLWQRKQITYGSGPTSANHPSGRSAHRHFSSQYYKPVCLALSLPNKAPLPSTSSSLQAPCSHTLSLAHSYESIF